MSKERKNRGSGGFATAIRDINMRNNTRVGLLSSIIAVVLGAVTAYIYTELGSIEESVTFVLAAGGMILCCGLSFISAICAVVMFLTTDVRYERDKI